MTPAPSGEYLQRFNDALVSEIKAEMGRRDLSARGLAALIGVNPQYVTSRVAGGNPRTGKRVDITVADLETIAGALDLDALELMNRARAAAAGESSTDDLAARRGRKSSAAAPSLGEKAVAKRRQKRGEDEDDQ